LPDVLSHAAGEVIAECLLCRVEGVADGVVDGGAYSGDIIPIRAYSGDIIPISG